jgi:hypothetical protein
LSTVKSHESRFEERLLAAILDDFDQLTAPAGQAAALRAEVKAGKVTSAGQATAIPAGFTEVSPDNGR